ncbi:MAG: hypothetical protein ACLSGK_02295 [Lachnospiraceae bacterium]
MHRKSLRLLITHQSGGWTAGDDGYWYYDEVLPAGKETKTELNIKYTFPSGDDKPEEFNIVVIQECTPVLYKEDGTPKSQTGTT